MSQLLAVDQLMVATASGSALLRGLSFTVRQGQSLGIVGEAGAGKTVLLYSLLGMSPRGSVVSGSVRYKDRELLREADSQLRKLRGSELSIIAGPARAMLNPLAPVGNQIANVIRAHRSVSSAIANREALDLISRVDIADPAWAAKAYPHELSGGMAQRILIAIALANNPRLILADEPTAGLDTTVQLQVLRTIKHLVDEMDAGLIVVTRDLGIIAHFCHDVMVMREGRVVEQGGAGQFFAAPRDQYSAALLESVNLSRIQLSDAAEVQVSATERMPITLRIVDLVKDYPLSGGRALRAVNGVAFTVEAGETMGLVGESGSGKTTVARCILNLTTCTSGHIEFGGVDLAAASEREMNSIRRRIQAVFQDPQGSLNPSMSIKGILSELILLHRVLPQSQVVGRVRELLDLVDLPPSILGRRPHQLSAGICQRVAIARALSTNPELLILDEPTSLLDIRVRADIISLLQRLQRELKLTYLFISHDLTAIRHIADRTTVMYLGSVVEDGPTAELFTSPRHPYTKALLSAVLNADPKQPFDPFQLEGEIPSPINAPFGCPLQTRCPLVRTACREAHPPLVLTDFAEHRSACLFWPEMMGAGDFRHAEVPRGATDEAEPAEITTPTVQGSVPYRRERMND